MQGSRVEPAYVFGYGSLADLSAPLRVEDEALHPVVGRLHGFRRHWGVAMNNWEAPEAAKHYLDPVSGEKPHLRVAYLDIEEKDGATVNGLAVPVNASRLAALDARELNYERFEVSTAFRPTTPGRVYAYRGSGPARQRCQTGAEHGDVVISQEYLDRVQRAFTALEPDGLAEFERTTGPLPFPLRNLKRIPASG